MSVAIDYLAFTFKSDDVQQVLNLLFRHFPTFTESRGHHGYLSAFRSSGVAVYFDGSPGMGIHVQISGAGCATVSNSKEFHNWGSYISDFLAQGATCRRVDLAFDDKDGLLDLSVIRSYIDEGNFTSKYREWSTRNKRSGTDLKEDIIYMGGIGSDSTICFYDKRVEQLGKGLVDPGRWVRAELRHKAELAQATALWIVANPTLEGISGLLKAKLDFKIDDGLKNKTRRTTVKWWEDFLGQASKLVIVPLKVVKTLEERLQHFLVQHSPTLYSMSVASEAMGWGARLVEDIIAGGKSRMKERHIHNVSEWLNTWRANTALAT